MTREAMLETALRKIIALADDASTAAVHDIAARIVATAEAALGDVSSTAPHVITPDMAIDAQGSLQMAADAALLLAHTENGRYISPLKSRLQAAAKALGFTLFPASLKGGPHEDDVASTANRDPDSGRLIEGRPAATSDFTHNFGG